MVTKNELDKVLKDIYTEYITYFRGDYLIGCLDTLSQIRDNFNIKDEELEKLRTELA